jgi:hypothetical protein
MPSQDVVDRFVATVVSGDYVGAIERFYAPGASIQENQDTPRVGRDELVRHERVVLSMFRSSTCEIVGPPLVDADHVAIRWRFVSILLSGETTTLQEVAWQRWDGDRIVEEIFFYDPKQLPSLAA